ncbi:RHS repeat-associated core domain-containing protein [Streptomyces sp. NPDC088746]|uniref:RHS repeat-associated core domain-containing protein n=1 Tax=Streptomyces sp. NPDC088746 TaxID=3365885 RepID=UPI0037F83626
MAAVTAKCLVAGLLSVFMLSPDAAALPDGSEPSVAARPLKPPVPEAAEPSMTKAPEVTWPAAKTATVDLSASTPAKVSVVSVTAHRGGAARTAPIAPGAGVATPVSKVDVRVLDRHRTEAVGGLGLALQVSRRDEAAIAGAVDVAIDYSGFAHAYGGNFASRLRLVKLPACAATTPEAAWCRQAEYVEATIDTAAGTLRATVEASPNVAQISGMAAVSQPSVYALTSGSSSDKGDYRASTLSPTGKWDVSLGSGAFTYSVPIEVPDPPVGEAPSLSLNYNSQSVDGRTSTSNNQSSWVGMGWDLNVGYIERRYRNCTQDGHPTFGDLCWDSPNSTKDPNGAVYVINIGGVTSELIQDDTGTGSFHLQDDPGWRVQKLNGGYGSDNTDEFWVVTHQDGTRNYFGWGRAERKNSDGANPRTNSVLTAPVIGDDEGEPCHASYPSPCQQAWRWNLDREVTPNEVENSYFYAKERNYYRSVAAADKARGYDSASYLERVEYGWSSQIPGAQLPAMVKFQHVNRCVERMAEKDPLNNATPECPTIDAKPASYPDVPVDLICDGPDDGESCAGKTYYPTFFQRSMLWDINTYVRDNDSAAWDVVTQYQMKYALTNPEGVIDGTLWLDYIQRRGYSGDDITLPTINFNGEYLDNQVGSSLLNFRRINKVYTDLGSTVAVTYGHATDEDGTIDRQCDAARLPTQSDNTYECFWQKWTPEGAEEAKTGWFKKFVVTKVVVDPGDGSDGAPAMTSTYEYDGAPGWRFTADPLTKDEDETWSEWRGYGKVLVTTGANTNKHSTYHWFYRGLDGDRTDKADPAKTRAVQVTDSEGAQSTDHAWLAGKTLETSQRDNEGASQRREWHDYWTHNTAQYTGLPDARLVRESKTRTLERVHSSTDALATWREHIVENEYDDKEAASTTFGLPMRVDDWGETNVSDNTCTEFGRAYNTEQLDGTGTRRWMVYPDEERHYSVSCTTQAEDQAAGNPALHQDSAKTTFYDNATSLTENDTKLTDGNATEARSYTDATHYRSSTAVYDQAGRVTTSWDGKKNATTTGYTPATSWPVDGIKVTGPDPDGTGPLTAQSATTYLSRYFGAPWKTVDANGNTTRVTLDALGRTIKVFKPTEAANYPDGTPSMRFSYDVPVATSATGVPGVATGSPARVTSETLQAGTTYLKTVAYVDGLGRTRETQHPAPSGTGRAVQVTRYDSSGNVAGTSGAFYNDKSVDSGMVNPTVASLPAYNDLQVDWAGRTTLSQLMAKGVPQPQNKTVTRYGGADLTTVFPPTGTPKDTYKDLNGNIVKVVEHIGATSPTTTYEYTRKGDLKYVHDARGNTLSHYTYNWVGERTVSDDKDSGQTTTTFDPNGNIETVTDAAKNVITHGYDNLGRQTSLKSATGTLSSWAYDTAPGGKGLLASSTSYANGQAYTSRIDGYDARGRATAKTTVIPTDGNGLQGSYTFTYHYDANDQTTSVDYPAVAGLPAETVTTSFTAAGDADTLSSPLATYLAGAGYDDLGRLTSRSYGKVGTGTSATRVFTYDDANATGWLKSVTTDTRTGTATKRVQEDVYARDNAGVTTSLRDNTTGQQECFGYDDLSRLSAAWTTTATACGTTPTSDFAGPDPYQQQYAYDQLGNLQSLTATTATGSTTRDYKYPGYSADEKTYAPDQARPHAVSEVTTPSGKDTYGYNETGDLTSRTVGGVSSVLAWDAEHRLTKVTQKKTTGDEVSTYVYDVEGKILLRTGKNEKVLYLDGQEIHSGTGGPKATRYYAVEGTAIAMRVADGTATGQLMWLMSETQNSTQLVIAQANGVVIRRRYLPFGEQRGATSLPTGTDRGFTGKTEDDSTGLVIMGARLYDPALGRFLSPDALAAPYLPQSLNGYSYSVNNPIAYSDPSGLFFGLSGFKNFWRTILNARHNAAVMMRAWAVVHYDVANNGGKGRVTTGRKNNAIRHGSYGTINKKNDKDKNTGYADLIYWTDDAVYVWEIKQKESANRKSKSPSAEAQGPRQLANYLKYLTKQLRAEGDKRPVRAGFKFEYSQKGLSLLNNELITVRSSTKKGAAGIELYTVEKLRKKEPNPEPNPEPVAEPVPERVPQPADPYQPLPGATSAPGTSPALPNPHSGSDVDWDFDWGSASSPDATTMGSAGAGLALLVALFLSPV